MRGKAKKDSTVPLTIRFQPVRLGGRYDGEEACLGLANDHLVTVLVPVSGEEVPSERQGWFLEVGFGPCYGEGLLFATLEAAETWMRSQIPSSWAAATRTAADENQPETPATP